MTNIHPSHRPCLVIAVCLALGIAIGPLIKFHMGFIIGLVVFLMSAFVIVRRRWAGALILYLIFVGCGMIIESDAKRLPEGDIGRLDPAEAGQIAVIEGIVDSAVTAHPTARGEKTSFELRVVEGCAKSGHCLALSGKVMVNIFRRESVDYGARLKLSGRLHKPFVGSTLGHYSYEDHLKRNRIYWLFSVKKAARLELVRPGEGNKAQAFVFQLHHRLKNVLESHLGAFEAGFIQSLVLGGKYYMPDRTRDLFVQTGTAHILAISGMNVASMALLIFIFLNILRVPRIGQIALTILCLALYCALTGSNPSVVRATVMATVLLGGFLIEREQDTLNSLGMAAIIILLADPMSLWDIGFQLSFAGVFSIIYLYPRIYACVEPRLKGRAVVLMGQMICVSLAAWIGTLPLIAYYFQVVTPVSVMANIPTIPFVTALFMLGVGLLVCGLILPLLSPFFAACIKVVLFGLMVVIEFFGRIPYGSFFIKETSLTAVMIYYLLVGVLLTGLRYSRRSDHQTRMLHYLN